MGSLRCTADEAFDRLVRQWQTTNTKLRDVARSIVDYLTRSFPSGALTRLFAVSAGEMRVEVCPQILDVFDPHTEPEQSRVHMTVAGVLLATFHG